MRQSINSGFNRIIRGVLILAFTTCSVTARGQTCCTGNAQITGYINQENPGKNNWYISFLIDYNSVATLMQNGVITGDDYLTRATTTYLGQVGYGIADGYSFSVLVPFVHLKESVDVNQLLIRTNSGFGDITLFNQLVITKTNLFGLQAGLGLKLPTGATQAREGSNQIVLNPTLQLGTGSIDLIGQLSAQLRFPSLRSLLFQQLLSFRYNTESNQLAGHYAYQYGNELIILSSLLKQIVIGRVISTPMLSIMYRYSARNLIERFPDPNSGGHWLSLQPSVGISWSDKSSISLFGELPIARYLNGFQLTTSYKLVGSFQYKF